MLFPQHYLSNSRGKILKGPCIHTASHPMKTYFLWMDAKKHWPSGKSLPPAPCFPGPKFCIWVDFCIHSYKDTVLLKSFSSPSAHFTIANYKYLLSLDKQEPPEGRGKQSAEQVSTFGLYFTHKNYREAAVSESRVVSQRPAPCHPALPRLFVCSFMRSS